MPVPNGNFLPRSRGLALVQVLLITGIISVLLLIMVTYTKMHTRQAQAVHNQLEERFELYSVASELQFALLTQSWVGVAQDNVWAKNWNFYGQVFNVDGYEVSIQNVGSLVSTLDAENIAKLLELFGVNAGKARSMADTLRNWQQVESSSNLGLLMSERQQEHGQLPIQHSREISLLNGWDTAIVAAIEPYVTTHSVGALNSAHLPSELLSLAVTSGQAEAIVRMRQEGRVSRQRFSRVSGLVEGEFLSFFPGPIFLIEVIDTQRLDGLRLQLNATFKPYGRHPYSLHSIMYY